MEIQSFSSKNNGIYLNLFKTNEIGHKSYVNKSFPTIGLTYIEMIIEFD